MSLKNWLFFIGAMAIITPILCNFIVLTPAHPCYNVAGNQDRWLSFFGSYVGSIISAAVAFVVLWYNRKDNTKHVCAQLKSSILLQQLSSNHKEILDIQKDMAERFAQYDISLLINLKSICKNTPKELTENLPELQRLYSKFESLRNSATLLYGEEYDESCKSFFCSYDTLMVNTLDIISGYIKLITIYKDTDIVSQELKSSLMQIGKLCEKCTEDNSIVMKNAKLYVKHMISQYKKEQIDIINILKQIEL